MDRSCNVIFFRKDAGEGDAGVFMEEESCEVGGKT